MRGETNYDYTFPFESNAKLALKLANAKETEDHKGRVVKAIIEEGDNLLAMLEPEEAVPSELEGKPLFWMVTSEDGEWLVSRVPRVEWVCVA